MTTIEARGMLQKPLVFGDSGFIHAKRHLELVDELEKVRVLAKGHELLYCFLCGTIGDGHHGIRCECDHPRTSHRSVRSLDTAEIAKELNTLKEVLELLGVSL